MSNVIKYTTTPVNNTIKKGNFALGINDVDYGPTNITGFYMTTIPSTSGYTIYNENGGTLSYQSVSGTTPLISYLSNKRGVNMTTAGESLSWAAGQSNIFVTNREYENIVTSGMVLNLDAGFVSSYPTSATTWYDLSYSGNNGTLTNGPTFNSFNGGSIVFDGVDDYVNCGNGSTLNLTSGITITSIYRLNGLPSASGNPNVVDKWDWPNNLRSFSMGTESGLFSARVSYDGSFNNSIPLFSSNQPQIGGLYFQTLTYDGQVGLMYLNELPTINSFATLRGIFNNPTTEVWVGRSRDSGQGGRWINANIFETQIYNRALTPFEVYQNYNAMKGRFGIPDIVTSGLTLNLDAGNPYSYNPLNTGSTTWSNTTNTTTGGTLTNGTFYSGGTMVFDGVDDYVNCGNNPVFDLTNQLTLECWVKTSDVDEYNHFISKFPANNCSYLMGSLPSSGYMYFSRSTNGTNQGVNGQFNINLCDGTWKHVVVSYNSDTSTLLMSVNGNIQSSSLTGNVFITTTDVNIGRRTGVGQYYNANIANVKIYNRALNPIEIYQNFNALKNRYGFYDIVQEGLVLNLDAGNPNSYNPLNTGSTTWNDVSGYGNNGTLINGTYYSGGTMVYDGTNDLVNTSLATQGITEFSTDVIFRTTTTYDTSQYYNCPSICGTAQGGGTSGDWLVAVKNGYLVSYDELTGGNNNIDLNVFVSNNNWYHLQVTKTVSGVVTYYLNGVQILQLSGRTSPLRTTSTTSTIYGTNWMVGSAFWTESTYRNFQGQIALNTFYNRALTAAEAQQNFNALRYRFGL